MMQAAYEQQPLRDPSSGVDATVSAAGATTVGGLVFAVLAGIAYFVKWRAERPRDDAARDADIAASRFNTESAATASQLLELLRQQVSTLNADLQDIKQRSEEQRMQTEAAQQEVLRLRGELSRLQSLLDSEQKLRLGYEAEVQTMRRRVGQLESELRRVGLEPPQ